MSIRWLRCGPHSGRAESPGEWVFKPARTFTLQGTGFFRKTHCWVGPGFSPDKYRQKPIGLQALRCAFPVLASAKFKETAHLRA
jgi:hypothetical protein